MTTARRATWLCAVTLLAVAQAATLPRKQAQQAYNELSGQDRERLQQTFRQMTAAPRIITPEARTLWGELAISRGDIYVMTQVMPQPLADALIKAARGGAKVTVLSSAPFIHTLRPLKAAGVALYESAFPVEQGLLVYNSTVVTGELVNAREEVSTAFESLSAIMSLRQGWPHLLNTSRRM